MDLYRAGDRQRVDAPKEYFTGKVEIEPILSTPPPASIRSLVVHFSPGGRTNWHTHPLGQTIYVLSGRGLAQVEGGPLREIRPGDVVWFPADTRHWHGAAPDSAMCHVAMQEEPGEMTTVWAEPVSEADYTASVQE